MIMMMMIMVIIIVIIIITGAFKKVVFISVGLSVRNVTQKVKNRFWWNFQEMTEMQWGISD